MTARAKVWRAAPGAWLWECGACHPLLTGSPGTCLGRSQQTALDMACQHLKRGIHLHYNHPAVRPPEFSARVRRDSPQAHPIARH